MSIFLHNYSVLFICIFLGCASDNSGELTPRDSSNEFSNPERVTILGYDDDAMEPYLSYDGKYLFFNNSNDPHVNTSLQWAERIDELNYQYKGEIKAADTPALEGVPSMDSDNIFYFISTRSYEKNLSTIYRGRFVNGTISEIELVAGISSLIHGMVNFDAEISPDGNTLYFVDGRFDGGGIPQTADIFIAERSGKSFLRLTNNAALMKKINTDLLEYEPAVSASGLEIFFTRLKGDIPAIYTATRTSTSAPFNTPKKIQAIRGFGEGPALSTDGKSLYYHKYENERFVIYRVKR